MKKSPQALTVYQTIDKDSQPVLLEQQIIYLLQKTPTKAIYERPAKGGGKWKYVKGSYVKKALNYAFAWNWDFEVKEKGREGDVLWVLGKLTVRTQNGQSIVKEQFGRADIKFKKNSKDFLDYGNDLKAAATDALKKCASELGIASDVYAEEEYREIEIENVSDEEQQQMVDGKKPATPEQIETIKKLLPEKEWADVDSYGYTRQQAADKIKSLLAVKG